MNRHTRPDGTERVAIGRDEVLLQRVLTDAAAARTAALVLDPPPELRDACWHVGADLCTIGEPLYRNRARPDYYAERARATNLLLYESYTGLYDRVADMFESRYRVPVAFVQQLAVPGFHVIRYDLPGRHEGGGWHLDQVAWQVPYFVDHAAEVRGILNFTLPLVVPSGGTGMDLAADTGGEGAPMVQIHVPYRPGVMLFSECEVSHRIGASTSRRPDELRLTLQGHGVLFRGRLLLFW